MTEQESLSSALRSAVANLQYAARVAGVIGPDDRIDYVPGSRSNGQPPRVDVRSLLGTWPLDLMPAFSHTTRAREVAVAMETAATTLRRLTDQGILPTDT